MLSSMRRKQILIVVAMVGAMIAFDLMDDLVGDAAGAVAAIPILLAAWLFGARAAVATALTAAVVATALSASRGEPLGTAMRIEGIEAIALSLVGIAVGTAQDAKRRIARLMETDPATGLLNRIAFVRSLEAHLRTGRRPHAGSDLVVIDMIRFRQITETFGHEIGDALLRAIGQRLRSYAQGEDRVARITSGRFLIWLPAAKTAMHAAHSVLAAITEPYDVGGSEVRVEARVAVARHPDHASSALELVRRVEMALDEGRANGRSAVVATLRSEQEQLSRLETYAGLRAAIGNGELRLHYQPIVELPSAQIRGVEALVRWQHPARGLLAPGEFIPVAEQSGLIVPLTAWVLNEALRQSRTWSDEGRPMRIAINIGAKSLAESASLPTMLGDLLRSYGVDPGLITLELTESDIMTDAEQAIECLRELKSLGVRIEVDDFGTGYSSLAYLQRLPLDAVKIDRSFIMPMFGNAGTSSIVRAAIELSHALGLEAVAEGVEDPAVVEMLATMGCDFAQGYVFARPMPAEEVGEWMTANSPGIEGRPRPAPSPTETSTRVPAGATGTILVVDDEHPFRLSAHRILTAQGYEVLHAATASEALRLCATHGEIDLVLTDLFLSDWQGDKLAAHLHRLYPALRVMFMSGDPAGNRLAGGNTFLAKPFSRQQLVSGITTALAS
jgi:diguanylate cyclase (GGDEF)-like protein